MKPWHNKKTLNLNQHSDILLCLTLIPWSIINITWNWTIELYIDTIAHTHKPKFIYTYQTGMNILNIFQ